MKKLIISTICFVAICMIFSFTVLPNLNKSDATEQPSEPESCPSLTYIVKNFNGNIAVFESNSPKPFRVFEIPVNTLPYNDQKSLESGIITNNKEELNKLIEDLCS